MLTGCGAWTVQVDLEALAAQVQFADHPAGAVVPPAALSVRSGWIWSTITVDAQQAQVRTTLKGLPREQARSLETVLQRARHLTELRRVVDDAHVKILAWAQAVQQQAGQWAGRWWSRELVADWVRSRPSLDGEFEQARQVRELQVYLRAQPAAVQQAMAWWDADLAQHAAARNQRFLGEETDRRAGFFAAVESSPLTAEQVRAVVCFENRVQVVAAAGSGKTSTMVARAAYAVAHDLVPPDSILMLAFNKKAAQELVDRVRRRAGDRGHLITASTFHAFGLSVIGQATGRKPRVPPGLGHDGDGQTRLERVVDALRDRDLRFRVQWDLFRLVFGRPLADFGAVEDPEAWDATTGSARWPGRSSRAARS